MKKAAEKMVEILEQNQISVQQVARDTGVAVNKLSRPCKENLNATELLVLCSYLNIHPEDMR